jgi:hypothetical protein
MSDQWRANVRTIAGEPVAVVEVTIKRSIFIDADVYERVSRLLATGGDAGEPSGLAQVGEFYEMVRRLPEEARSYIVVPWTDAEGDRIGLRPFAELLRLFEDRAYFRVEGSASSGFVGYFTFGGQDRKVDLSRDAIPAFRQKLEATRADASADMQRGMLTREEFEALERLCDDAGRRSHACEQAYRGMAELSKERERVAREQQERELRRREKELKDGATSVREFPDGMRDISNIA